MAVRKKTDLFLKGWFAGRLFVLINTRVQSPNQGLEGGRLVSWLVGEKFVELRGLGLP